MSIHMSPAERAAYAQALHHYMIRDALANAADLRAYAKRLARLDPVLASQVWNHAHASVKLARRYAVALSRGV